MPPPRRRRNTLLARVLVGTRTFRRTRSAGARSGRPAVLKATARATALAPPRLRRRMAATPTVTGGRGTGAPSAVSRTWSRRRPRPMRPMAAMWRLAAAAAVWTATWVAEARACLRPRHDAVAPVPFHDELRCEGYCCCCLLFVRWRRAGGAQWVGCLCVVCRLSRFEPRRDASRELRVRWLWRRAQPAGAGCGRVCVYHTCECAHTWGLLLMMMYYTEKTRTPPCLWPAPAEVPATAEPSTHTPTHPPPPHEPTTRGPSPSAHGHSSIPTSPEETKRRTGIEAAKFRLLSHGIFYHTRAVGFLWHMGSHGKYTRTSTTGTQVGFSIPAHIAPYATIPKSRRVQVRSPRSSGLLRPRRARD